MDLSTFMQEIINSISLGSLYALLAIGYTLVYSILRVMNFAHGDIFMLGAYFVFYTLTVISLPWYMAFPLAILMTIIVGIILERIAYKPLRNSARATIMISSICVVYLIENLATMIFGEKSSDFPRIDLFSSYFSVGGVSVSVLPIVILVTTLILVAALFYIIKKTKMGLGIRAVSKDYEAASLMGINVNTIITVTFGIGVTFAAVGAILWSLEYPSLMPVMGFMPGLKCLIIAVVFGIGNIRGAIIGGFILGFLEIIPIAFLPELTDYSDTFAFVLLILVLLIKPYGIMGKTTVVKV